MRRALHFIAIDLGVSVAITCGLTAFWLLCIDAATDDVAALTQRAAANRRASAYVESIMTADHWPSHGQLIVAQATVTEMLNNASEAQQASPAAHTAPLRAYAPLLVPYLSLTIGIAVCIRRLRRSRKG